MYVYDIVSSLYHCIIALAPSSQTVSNPKKSSASDTGSLCTMAKPSDDSRKLSEGMEGQELIYSLTTKTLTMQRSKVNASIVLWAKIIN